MQPYWPFEYFFVNWKQYISVICCLVVIETETKEYNAFPGNRSDVMIERTPLSRDIKTFTGIVMPICPPPNNLHLLCDVTFVNERVNCSERAFVIQLCLDIFEEIYVQSNWNLCESDLNQCLDIVVLLQDKGYLNRTNVALTSTERNREPFASESSIISTIMDTSGLNATVGIFTSETTSYQTTNNVTISIDTTVVVGTLSSTLAIDSGDLSSTENADEERRSATYIYALIGILVVFIEIAILFLIYFYLKKKQRLRPYRHPSKESLREEIIAPETTSPTEALVLNSLVYDDEDIFKQDQKIYQSYLNLRFIDDSSVECTPEKIILK